MNDTSHERWLDKLKVTDNTISDELSVYNGVALAYCGQEKCKLD
jgi:hypothetical protein